MQLEIVSKVFGWFTSSNRMSWQQIRDNRLFEIMCDYLKDAENLR